MAGTLKRKRYLIDDVQVPRTTAWRLRKKREAGGNGSDANDELDQHISRSGPSYEEMDALDMEHAHAHADSHPEELLNLNCADLEASENILNVQSPPGLEIEDEYWNSDDSVSEPDIQPPPICEESNAETNIDEKLNHPLFPKLQVTVLETMLLLMNFILKFELPWSAMEELFHIVNVIFGQHVLPKTKYMTSKIFNGMNNGILFHLFCPDCQSYLQMHTRKEDKKHVLCPDCQKTYVAGSLITNGSFYVTLPIEQQVKDILKCPTLAKKLDECLENLQDSEILRSVRDITDGSLYQKQRRRLDCSRDDLTVTMNTDGSPVFKSSNTSMWPIQLVLNELPPKLRWNNVIICGLWFGKAHPNMRLFLKSFVEDMASLAETPIQWTSPGASNMHSSRIYCVCACVDSPARAIVQNTTQYNGYFGCSWCLHRGVTIAGSSQVKYITGLEPSPDRTEKSMKADMKKALQEGCSSHGVKGPSPLLNLPGFDIVWSFSPDYMHSILLGVVRQVTDLWMSNVHDPYYIGFPANVRKIDGLIKKIRMPHVITRFPRPISVRKYWKATEWRNWLLYFSIPCLSDLLPRKFLDHWALLVRAVFLTLQDNVLHSDINTVDCLFTEFVIKTEMLYGMEAMTSNMHQLLHHAKSLKLLGPAWGRSAFVFEGQNGALLKHVKAAKGAPMQVLNRYLFRNKVRSFACNENAFVSARVRMELQGLLMHDLVKNCQEICDGNNMFYMLGFCKLQLTVAEETALLSSACTDLANVKMYSRMIEMKSNTSHIYHSQMYSRPKKIDNTVIQSINQEFYKIRKFISYVDNSSKMFVGALCQKLVLLSREIYVPPHMFKCDLPPSEQAIYFLTAPEIFQICAFLDLGHTKYVCKLPNVHERD